MAVSKTEGLHDAVEMTKSEECADSRNKDSERVLSQEEMDKLGAEVLVSDFKQIKLEKEAQKNWDLFYKRNSTNFFKDRHWTSREFEELQACREVSRWRINPGRLTEVALLHNHTITVFLFQDSFRKVSTFQTWRTKDFPSGALDTLQFNTNFPAGDGCLLRLAVLLWPVWSVVGVPEAGAAGGWLWGWKLHLPSAGGRPQTLRLRLRLLTASCGICQGLVSLLKLIENCVSCTNVDWIMPQQDIVALLKCRWYTVAWLKQVQLISVPCASEKPSVLSWALLCLPLWFNQRWSEGTCARGQRGRHHPHLCSIGCPSWQDEAGFTESKQGETFLRYVIVSFLCKAQIFLDMPDTLPFSPGVCVCV